MRDILSYHGGPVMYRPIRVNKVGDGVGLLAAVSSLGNFFAPFLPIVVLAVVASLI